VDGVLDLPEKVGSRVGGVPVVGTDQDLPHWVKQGASFLVTVGQVESCESRKRIFRKLIGLQAECATVVSPRAYVAADSTVGPGSIVMHDALINMGASVGANCIINTKALIEHQATIADHCHISTGAVVNGGARIGNGVFFGSNAVCPHAAVIPDDSFIRAGSLARG